MSAGGLEVIPRVRSYSLTDDVETITSATSITLDLGGPPPGYAWDVLGLAAAVPGDAGPWLATVYVGSASVPEHAVAVGRSQAGDPAVTFDTPRELVVSPGERLQVTLSGYAGAAVGTAARARARFRLVQLQETTWPAQPTPVVVVGYHPEQDWAVEVPTEAVDG